MTKTRDLANLIADSKVGPSEIDTTGTYQVNGLGVGTPASHSLHIKGSTQTNAVLAVESSTWSSGSTAEIRLAYVDGHHRSIKGHYDNGMEFYTNSTDPAMTIDGTGKVGIGEPSPNQPLVVKKATDGAVIVANTAQAGGQGIGFFTDTANNRVGVFNNSSSTLDMVFNTGGTATSGEAMRIDNATGFVNIGGQRTADESLIELNKSGSNTTGEGHIGFGGGSDPLWAIRFDNSDFNMRLDRSYAGWQSTPALSVRRANGNVGINTDDATALLTVSSGTYLSNASTTGSQITLNSDNTASWTGTRELISFESVGNGADHRTGTLSVKLKKGPSDSALTEFMQINAVSNYTAFQSGNVAIGNTDNDYKLSIGNSTTHNYLEIQGGSSNVMGGLRLKHHGGGGRTGVAREWVIAHGSDQTQFNTGVSSSAGVGGLVFWSQETGAANLDAMRLKNDGNAIFGYKVGVNKTAPTSHLDVGADYTTNEGLFSVQRAVGYRLHRFNGSNGGATKTVTVNIKDYGLNAVEIIAHVTGHKYNSGPNNFAVKMVHVAMEESGNMRINSDRTADLGYRIGNQQSKVGTMSVSSGSGGNLYATFTVHGEYDTRILIEAKGAGFNYIASIANS
jgi:hypothetical protein